VTAEARKIFEQALALPEQERAALIDALADTLQGEEQAEIDEAWRVEILRRVEQVRKGEVTLESWEDVRRAGREALAPR
jgi:putative addiction module component (TIGR02574 family)